MWKEYLLRQARMHRMCEDNKILLSKCASKEEVISLYKRTIDWALEEDYPNLHFLRKEFSDQEQHGIFIDKHFCGELLNAQQVYVFHNCTGTISVDLNVKSAIIPMLYFANGCNISIKDIEKPNIVLPIKVPLYIFGDNNIKAKDTENIIFRKFEFEVKGGGR